VKYSGSDVFLQLYKYGWSIPRDTKIPSWLQFDNSQRFPMIGYGDNHRNGMGYVEYTVENGKEADFLSLFSDANRMILGFEMTMAHAMIRPVRSLIRCFRRPA
jgi:hypothetical protein